MTTALSLNRLNINQSYFTNHYNKVRKVNYAAHIIMEKEFWKKKKLYQLSVEEWEALCDHCGKCCLIKHDFFGKTVFTNFHCKYLNLVNCQCKIYEKRTKTGSCLKVDMKLLNTRDFLLPDSCAYKRLFRGQDLPEWHPLITGTYQSVIDSKNTVSCLGPISEEFSSCVDPQPLEITE